jgi:hypothetical protein
MVSIEESKDQWKMTGLDFIIAISMTRTYWM